jgi:phage baseplate assembly protein W
MSETNTVHFSLKAPLQRRVHQWQRCEALEESVAQSIRLILSTRLGTLPISYNFGCRIHELVFRPITPALERQAAFFVEHALALWEPRAQVLNVSVDSAMPQRDAAWNMCVTIEWRLASELAIWHVERKTVISLNEDTLVVD